MNILKGSYYICKEYEMYSAADNRTLPSKDIIQKDLIINQPVTVRA
jgi:hypothetical protein